MILFVVVFGFGTFFVFGGVIFTVNLHVPFFNAFTFVADTTLQTFAVDVFAEIFDFLTTVIPSVFKADKTVAVFFNFSVATLGAVTAGDSVVGAPAAGEPAAGVPADGAVTEPFLTVALNAPPAVPTANFTPAVADARTV